MNNYNLKLDALKLKGARVIDNPDGNGGRGVFIPINNKIGTVTDGYIVTDKKTGLPTEKASKSVYINLTVFELHQPKYGQTHFLKPALNKSVMDGLTDEQLRLVPFVGNLKPWTAGDNQKED